MITENLDLARRSHYFLFITRFKVFSIYLTVYCWSDMVTKSANLLAKDALKRDLNTDCIYNKIIYYCYRS